MTRQQGLLCSDARALAALLLGLPALHTGRFPIGWVGLLEERQGQGSQCRGWGGPLTQKHSQKTNRQSSGKIKSLQER